MIVVYLVYNIIIGCLGTLLLSLALGKNIMTGLLIGLIIGIMLGIISFVLGQSIIARGNTTKKQAMFVPMIQTGILFFLSSIAAAFIWIIRLIFRI